MRRKLGLALLVIGLFVGFGFYSCHMGKKVNVLVITGGHEFDEEGFNQMLDKLSINYDLVEHPNAFAMLGAENIAKYDVVLLYDMPKEITEKTEIDFYIMLEKGIGLVVLHHAIGSYDFWPDYARIIGGRYHNYSWSKNGVSQPLSTYKHDVQLNVKVGELKHPVTEGVEDFQITDETYGNLEILPTVHPLLSTDEPSSSPLVCWANLNRNSRIVALTLGHDKRAWENPSFLKILSQAISWTAEKK